ncbi:transporter suffix domain-containing protein [Chengkuizengella axinellae]|uniref:transporter suffix domain-containing protein n=1 Tax=Chengkuizengella axinellae TaxID=3064388 RepID=UPI00352917D1
MNRNNQRDDIEKNRFYSDFSFIFFYGLIFIVPFVNITTGFKAAVTGGLIIVGEVSFWVGGLILGSEVVKKYRSFFNTDA